MSSTTLSKLMRERAERDRLPKTHKLRTAADAFDAAVVAWVTDHPTIAIGDFMYAWATARKTWCSYTGEPLI